MSAARGASRASSFSLIRLSNSPRICFVASDRAIAIRAAVALPSYARIALRSIRATGSPDVRLRPVSRPAPGLAGLSCSFISPVGACGTTGRKAAPAAPAWCWHAGIPHAAFAAHGQWPSPTPKIVGLNRAVEADLRLRSARGWTLRLAACPRGCHWRRRAPVRASCRPDMHLDRPPVLPASVPVRFLGICDPHCVQGPASLRPSASRCHVSKTIATRPSPERDARRRYKSYREDQEQKANKGQLFFLRIRKALSAATTPKVALAWLNLN